MSSLLDNSPNQGFTVSRSWPFRNDLSLDLWIGSLGLSVTLLARRILPKDRRPDNDMRNTEEMGPLAERLVRLATGDEEGKYNSEVANSASGTDTISLSRSLNGMRGTDESEGQ
ncbi:hypothetical protein WG66_011331 [Moniliophthora roreri]|nr:hypothetical protein WG66_011331 [Moniliophthora roreri]